MSDEIRIYAIVAATIQVPTDGLGNSKPGHLMGYRRTKSILQPEGRQIAQACHVVSQLRWMQRTKTIEVMWEPITTIILQARDSAEMAHIHLLAHKKRLEPVMFSDENPEYGLGNWPTAVAFLAKKEQTLGICDYLPMWGTK